MCEPKSLSTDHVMVGRWEEVWGEAGRKERKRGRGKEKKKRKREKNEKLSTGLLEADTYG